MSTTAQISANQLNSQKSTGPTTEQGRINSSQNRRTHGLGGKFTVLPCESQEEFEALLQHLDNDYKPCFAGETILVERMAESRWLSDRALRLQQTSLDPNTGEIADDKKFSLYQRYFTTHNNAFHKALNDLLKQRKLKHDMRIGFEREKRNQDKHPFQIAIQDLEIGRREGILDITHGAVRPAREAISDRIWAEARQKAA
jgi:hypothetical protein